MEIMITEDAFAAVSDAVREGRRRGIEFGGSLIAYEGNGEVLIAYAVPTGPRAEQGPGHVTTDAAFQNEAIARFRQRLPQLSYVGDWHVHPMWLPELSATDRRTARDMLLEGEACRDRLVLLLGTAAGKSEPVVVGFVARLERGRDLRIAELPVRRVSGESVEVTSRLGGPLLPLSEVLSKTEDSCDRVEHGAARRIEEDLATIRAELGADTSLWTADDVLGVIIKQGRSEAFVVFPPEYPLGAPQVFAGSLDPGPLQPISLRYAWSSLHRLVDPVEDALAMPCRRPSVLRRPLLGRLVRPLLALGAVLQRNRSLPAAVDLSREHRP